MRPSDAAAVQPHPATISCIITFNITRVAITSIRDLCGYYIRALLDRAAVRDQFSPLRRGRFPLDYDRSVNRSVFPPVIYRVGTEKRRKNTRERPPADRVCVDAVVG